MSSYHSILEIVEQKHLGDDQEVQKLLAKAAELDQRSSEVARKALQKIHRRINVKASQKTRKPFAEPSKPHDPWRENLYLGETEHGKQLHVPLKDVLKHTAVLAQSGWGKTTLFRRLMAQLSNTDVNFLALDLNRDYRHLANTGDVEELVVFPFEKLKWNVMVPPPGRTAEHWKRVVAQTFAETQALLDASENYTEDQIDQVLQQYETLFKGYKEITEQGLDEAYSEQRASYPTLIDLEEAIDSRGYHPADPNKKYQKRVQNRLYAVINEGFHTIDCVQGHDLEKLLNEYNVVIELDGQRSKPQAFFMALLYAWILEYRAAQEHDDSQLRHVLFWDECKTMFSRYRELNNEAGLPDILDRHDKSRNFGQASIGADQEPLKLADSFLTNTYVKIQGTHTFEDQFQRAANSLAIPKHDQDQRRVARNIDTPYGLVRIGTRGPFKIKFPRYDVDEDVSDQLLEDMYAERWKSLMINEHSSTTNFGGSEDAEPSLEQVKRAGNRVEHTESSGVELSREGEELLETVVTDPAKILTERYDQLGSTYKGDQAKQELLNNNLVEEVLITGGRGKLLALTDTATQYLEQNDVEIQRQGRGGVEHRYWQHHVKDLLEQQGFEADIEVLDRDVYGLGNRSDIAVEIALGKNEREIDHIEEAIENGAERVLIACRTKQVKGYIQRKAGVADIDLSNVEFCTLNDLEKIVTNI